MTYVARLDDDAKLTTTLAWLEELSTAALTALASKNAEELAVSLAELEVLVNEIRSKVG